MNNTVVANISGYYSLQNKNNFILFFLFQGSQCQQVMPLIFLSDKNPSMQKKSHQWEHCILPLCHNICRWVSSSNMLSYQANFDITDQFTCISTTVIYFITYMLYKKIYTCRWNLQAAFGNSFVMVKKITVKMHSKNSLLTDMQSIVFLPCCFVFRLT